MESTNFLHASSASGERRCQSGNDELRLLYFMAPRNRAIPNLDCEHEQPKYCGSLDRADGRRRLCIFCPGGRERCRSLPMSDTYSSGTMLEPHYTMGVPAPRLHAFVNAPWTGATHHGAALIWRIAARGWAEAHKPFLPSTPGRALNGGHADALPTLQRLASLMPA